MPHVYCLDCDSKIVLHNQIQVGDECVCNECDAEFQIVNVSPVEIEWLYGNYDDDYDDDDDDDAYDDEEEDGEESEEGEEWAHLVAKQRRHAGHAEHGARRRTADLFDW